MERQLYLVLNNIRSAYNVGSMFRTADAVGVKKIFICGYTPRADHPKVDKTALGATAAVPWEYHAQVGRLLKKLKSKNITIAALEQSKYSTDLFRYIPPMGPLALIVGNEVAGLSKALLARVDHVLEIPMHGRKESLNVSVAAGIALYRLLYF